MDTAKEKTERLIRRWTIFFIATLAVSGLTAFPLQAELEWLVRFSAWMPQSIAVFIGQVYEGVNDTYAKYPFIAYGTDWLAFGHICIAIFFIGVLKDPVRNSWIVQAAMICCVLVLPLALICGPLRGIPFLWRCIDYAFGVVGLVPLMRIRQLTQKLTQLN